MIIFLSLKCFNDFFFMELFTGYLKTFTIEVGVSDWQECKKGDHNRRRGYNFCHFSAYVLIE